jgi:D-alanyl-D-alanine carboxypeptidase
VSGSVPRFVALMNARARELGLRCTRFAAPDGFIDEGNHSCPVDLALIAREVLDRPRLAKVVGDDYAVFRFPVKGGKLHLATHNPLLLDGYRGATGIKTGWTPASGRCFVGTAQRGKVRLGVVLLGSPDPGLQARRLLDAGFAAMRPPPAPAAPA